MTRRPAPTGEYAVGTMTYTVYDDRDEVLAPGTKRSIPARVYYPVDKTSVQGMNKLRYMSPEMAKALKKYMHAPINYEKSEAAGENFSECYENAPKVIYTFLKDLKNTTVIPFCTGGEIGMIDQYLSNFVDKSVRVMSGKRFDKSVGVEDVKKWVEQMSADFDIK